MTCLSRKIALWGIVVLCLLLSACAKPALISTDEPTFVSVPTQSSLILTDGLGRSITLDQTAQRVISMAPSNTEILFAIGAGPQVVGRDSFSDYPNQAKKITDIGGGFGELNSEAILSLKPDLVLAAPLTPPEQIKMLEDLGLAVFVLNNPKNFEGLYENLRIVAQLTGHEREVEPLIDDLKSRVSTIQEKVATIAERPVVFYELDGTDPNAPWTAGPGTFVAFLITMSGGENLGDILTGEWAQINIEELVSRDPDIILLGDFTWGGVTQDSISERAGWEALTAVKSGSVFPFDDNLVSRPGPRLVDGLEAMTKLLHPELFD